MKETWFASWFGLLMVAAACSGPRAAPPVSPTATVTTVGVVVTVTNLKYGTAIPSDFTVAVEPHGQAASVTRGSSMIQGVGMPMGVRYSVTVAGGPEGYSTHLSPRCSGVAEDGQEPCVITLTENPIACDVAMWEPVYLPFRLEMLSPCEIATGTVQGYTMERDGDLVIRIAPDPAHRRLLQPGNQYAGGFLIVEVPCQGPVVQADALGTCDKFRGGRIAPPQAGARLVAAAPWVLDRNHHLWGELHGARVMMLPR